MLRLLFVAAAVLLLVAVITRAAAARRTLWVMLALAVLYTALKLTGVIEDPAPARDGVF
jgi:hypothetical protein